MKSSKDRETLDKSETKILKSKDPRMEFWGTPENGTSREEKRIRIIYEDLRAIFFF